MSFFGNEECTPTGIVEAFLGMYIEQPYVLAALDLFYLVVCVHLKRLTHESFHTWHKSAMTGEIV
jgi:hypothetical protein